MIPNTNLNDDGTIWLKTTPTGERLIVGKQYLFLGRYWVYAGDFNDIREVPNIHCCYTIGNQIRVHTGVSPAMNLERKKIKRKRQDDGRKINTDISDQDNDLLTLVKTVIKTKDITRGDFKQAYDNDSDMNNYLRHIETQNTLSWPRFTDLHDRIKFGYKLTVFDENGVIATAISDNIPVPKELADKK